MSEEQNWQAFRAEETPEFVLWFEDHYMKPQDVYDSYGEYDEYWTRRLFSWMGWKAGVMFRDCREPSNES